MIPKPTLDFTPSLPVNAKNRLSLYGTLGLVLTAAIMTAVTVANAGDAYSYRPQGRLFVTVQPPTVAGIRPSPSGQEYYERSNPAYYPTARVIHLAEGAPPNACGPNRFEVLNHGRGPRCVGN